MWMFENAEFREWLDRRSSDPVNTDDLPEKLRRRCLTCGTKLEKVPWVKDATCGFCLAFEFGSDFELERLTAALAGIAKVVSSGDPAEAGRFIRGLLADVYSNLNHPHPG